mmetsp:Transcript_9303/g.15939  ORF Transcript_9303/g.15939 Transcript_9303/m.15939 type:complete len:218 (+) Transcript_9303:828-1481(+)
MDGHVDGVSHRFLQLFELRSQVVILTHQGFVGDDEVLNTMFEFLEGETALREFTLALELVEALAHEGLGVDTFEASEVEEHVVAEVETRVECIGRSLDHSLGHVGLHLLVDHEDDDSAVIDTTTTSTSGHLDVLASGDPAKVLAVELADVREDDGPGGHVEAHREGLCRKERLDETLLEKDLDDLLEDRQQTRVMDADSSTEEGKDVLDLREFLVVI